jgi:Domain of unknown function (DUF4157)
MVSVQPVISPQVTNKASRAANEKFGESRQTDTEKESSQPLFIQRKLSIGAADDPMEKEADDMADKVMRMPMPEPIHFSTTGDMINRKCAHCEGKEKEIRRKESHTKAVRTAPSIVHEVINSPGGNPLDTDTRSFMETRFNYDFSNVKIHDNDLAAKSAGSINALAYTSGNNIVFNSGQYNTGSDSGKRLLAHELTHVIQQKHTPALQRQTGDELTPLQTQPRFPLGKDISKMDEWELFANLQDLESELAKYTTCNQYTTSLEKEIERYIVKLNIVQGKTFSLEAIAVLRGYHETNAALDKEGKVCDSCIVAVNKGFSKLYGRTGKELGTTNYSIEKTMEGLTGKGLVSDKREIYFLNKRGVKTTGAAYPDKLEKSVWDSLIEMSNNDQGWIVYGMSLMDGEHSITITLDNNNPGSPKIFWSDQWGSKGGWKEFSKAGLDGEIVRLIRLWWNDMAEGKKHTTVVRLWRLKSK